MSIQTKSPLRSALVRMVCAVAVLAAPAVLAEATYESTARSADQSFDDAWDASWRAALYGDSTGPNDNTHILLAQADKGAEDAAAAEANKGEGEPLSPECAAFAQDVNANLGEVLGAGCQPTLAQMSKLMDNPLGNVAMFINQFDWYELENKRFGKTADQYTYTGIIQFPKRWSKNWNLINRIVPTVVSSPLDDDKIDRFSSMQGAVLPPVDTPVPPIELFGGRTTGLGDLYYVGIFSPVEPIRHKNGGNSVWGVGADVAFPIASEDILGTGKWSAGPAGLYAYLGKKWKLGTLVQQYWSFAGDSDRDDVNLTNLQYFYYYSLNDTTSIGAMPNILANWEADSDDRFTLPVGIGINKTINIGKVPVRFGLEYHHSVIQPDSVPGANWNIRFYVIPAAPSALFKWMEKPLFGG